LAEQLKEFRILRRNRVSTRGERAKRAAQMVRGSVGRPRNAERRE
jgi:hypothetical protein